MLDLLQHTWTTHEQYFVISVFLIVSRVVCSRVIGVTWSESILVSFVSVARVFRTNLTVE